MSIIYKDISTYSDLYRRYWKLILTNLLNGTSCILIPTDLELVHNTDDTSFLALSNRIGLTSFLKSRCKKHSDFNDKTKESQSDFLTTFIHRVGTYICDKMALHGYLVKIDVDESMLEGVKLSGATYVLSKGGIEISLKVQEHADNERRHSVTALFSSRAFGVSLIALSLAVVSAYLNYKRLDLYEEELQKVQSTQTAILSNIKGNKKQ